MLGLGQRWPAMTYPGWSSGTSLWLVPGALLRHTPSSRKSPWCHQVVQTMPSVSCYVLFTPGTGMLPTRKRARKLLDALTRRLLQCCLVYLTSVPQPFPPVLPDHPLIYLTLDRRDHPPRLSPTYPPHAPNGTLPSSDLLTCRSSPLAHGQPYL